MRAQLLHRLLLAMLTVSITTPVFARDRWRFRNRPAPQTICPIVPPSVACHTAPVALEKTYTVDFDKTEWTTVFKWLTEETKLVFISTVVPTGTLTLKSDDHYTLSQLFDLLDEVLEQKNWIIIRREHSFLIHHADEKIPPELLPQIKVEDLSKHGKREFVQVVIALKDHVAEDVAPQARKLLSKFGDLKAFGVSQLIIRDRVKNIRNIHGFLIEKTDCAGPSQFNYTCKFVRASVMAEKLRTLLQDRDTAVEINGRREPAAGKRSDTVQITVDHGANKIILIGSKSKELAAKALVKEIDIDRSESARPVDGDSLRKLFELPAPTPGEMAKKILEMHKAGKIKTLIIPDDKLLIYGTPPEHSDIDAVLNPPIIVVPGVRRSDCSRGGRGGDRSSAESNCGATVPLLHSISPSPFSISFFTYSLNALWL